MPVQSMTEFLDGLASSRLLEKDQIDELLRRPETPTGDLSAVGRFLQDRGWLTRFQVQEIREGRGAGLMFGPYRILERVADEPGWQLFNAYHPALHKPVVLRWIKAGWLAPADTLDAFTNRAQAASLVSHANLVNVLDAGTLSGVHYVAHEHLDGTDLGFFVAEMGALPATLACEYVRQAAAGLKAIHDKGIAHGDLGPGSLLLNPVIRIPSPTKPAETTARPAPTSRVHVGGLGLTPVRPAGTETPTDYLAPERATRTGFDPRSDVYSLGAAFYHLLAARSPGAYPPPVESLRADVPPPVAALVQRMLAADPAQRPSAAEVVEALRPFGLNPQPAAPAAAGVPLASETGTSLPAAAAPPVPIASETTSLPGTLQSVMQQIQAGASPAPFVEPLHDHPNGQLSPFGPAGAEEHHDPFAHHPDDMASGSGPAVPRQRQAEARPNRMVWLVAGLLLHLTAIGLLVAWVMGWFNKTEPAQTAPEQPAPKKKKRSTSDAAPVNWARVDVRGSDRTGGV